MSFLAPMFLAGALAAAVPIVLHLLRREPDARVKFSAVKLLRSAPVEHAQKRHLRELVLLALRVAALLLLTLAFARPFLTSGAAATSSSMTIVALDTSLSMSAPGQFEKARQLARQAIDRAAGDLIGVITFADVAHVASAPSGDRALARTAVDAARPGASSTRYRAALNAATSLLRGRRGTIVVVTDLQASGWDAGDRASVPDSVTIELADVGAPPQNLAVTALRLAGDRLIASIRNTAPQARDARVTLNVSNGPDNSSATSTAAPTTIPVGAQEAADVTFPIPRGRWASVTVDDRQGAEGDNARYLVLEDRSRPKVLVITATGDLSREAFYVQQALIAAGADGRAYEVEGVGGVDLQTWDASRFDSHTAVILLSTRGLDHRGRTLIADYARKGGGLLIGAGADVDGEVVSEALSGLKITLTPPTVGAVAGGARSLAPADVRHPLFQTFAGQSSLGLVKFRRVTTLRAADCATLARFTTGEPAFVECEPGEGRAVMFASDLNNQWNDFPLHATFVPFLHEAMQYLSGGRPLADYLVAQVPAGVPAVPGVATFGGVSGRTPGLVAVNVDPAESDSGRLTVDEFQTAVTRLKNPAVVEQDVEARQQEERQHLWQYVLALVLITLVAESVVAGRTA